MHRILGYLIISAALAHADDITLNDGKVYKNATIISHDVTSCTIESDKGGAIVPLEKLPPDLQQKLGYDPKVAKAETAQRDQARAEAEANLSEQAAFEKAKKKYVEVNGKFYKRIDSLEYDLIAKLASASEETLADGRFLGKVSFVNLYQTHDEVVSGSSAVSVPQAVPMGIEPAGNSVIIAATLNTDQIVTLKAVKIGVSEQGVAVFGLPQQMSIEDWRSAGRPQ